jgi:hypothetical protein
VSTKRQTSPVAQTGIFGDIKQKVLALHGQGYPAREIIRRLDPGTDRRVKWITMGNASFAHMVRSALKAAE